MDDTTAAAAENQQDEKHGALLARRRLLATERAHKQNRTIEDIEISVLALTETLQAAQNKGLRELTAQIQQDLDDIDLSMQLRRHEISRWYYIQESLEVPPDCLDALPSDCTRSKTTWWAKHGY